MLKSFFLSEKFYHVGLFLVAASMALPHDYPLYIPLFFGWVLVYRNTWPVILKSVEAKACVLLLLLFLIGLLYTENIAHGFATLEKRYFWAVNVWLLTGIPFIKEKAYQNIYKVYAWSIVAMMFFALTSALIDSLTTGEIVRFNEAYGVYENNFLYHKLASYVGMHAVMLALFVAVAFHILLEELISKKNKSGWNWIYYLGLALSFASVFLLKSASITIAFSFTVVLRLFIYVYHLPNFKKRYWFGAIAVSLLLAVSAGFFAYQKIDVKEDLFSYCIEDDPQEFNGLTIRMGLWWVNKQIVMDHGLFGVGTGDSDAVLAEYYDKYYFHFARRDLLHSHNQYLHITTLIGITGLLVLLFILYRGYYYAIKNADVVLLMLMILLTAFTVTDVPFASNKGIMFFTFFYFLSIYRNSPYKLKH